ncbi:MORN repeat-containing protein 3 isoform X1 [Anolis carolinensis]|uniref:MORN repeat-containing protein 3 isoform X1 n=2 Tax=Anolis carolinensis TaxID=28377 RepID=UPI0004626FEF|nr:PREDICTED: MORN repeat-containing protein 3 [Anolis carolinensis]|eukprot:XP_008119551.1 PREDICTED: MORN repeat-containing protein 3 [Anolis carolinensis]
MGQTSMPTLKFPKTTEPLWHKWDRKAQKCGLLSTVHAVNGDQYTGEWWDNLKHGKGIQKWHKTGAIYSGDWQFGKRHGYGIYGVPNPSGVGYRKVYAGWWQNDKMDGFGVKFFSETEYYEGDWYAGRRQGWGRMYYKDGSIYEGQWFEDAPNGTGMLRFKNENRYEGSWKNGKKHGPGKFIYLETGQLYEGFWVADAAKCGTMIDFGREEAPLPTRYPIPKGELADPEGVLDEAVRKLKTTEEYISHSQKK